jgi:prophage regulatory protein
MTRKILIFEELRDHGIVLGRRHLRRLEAAGKFPKRIKIGEHRVGWLADEIEAYIEAKIKERKP